jgi:hypothetical protein
VDASPSPILASSPRLLFCLEKKASRNSFLSLRLSDLLGFDFMANSWCVSLNSDPLVEINNGHIYSLKDVVVDQSGLPLPFSGICFLVPSL